MSDNSREAFPNTGLKMDEIKKLSDQLKESLSASSANIDAMKNVSANSSIQEALKTINSLKLPDPASFGFPDLKQPRIDLESFKMPTSEERNHYQSASVLMKRLANAITQWRGQLTENVQPAIVAILHGGVQVDVTTLAQESFHGIRVEGTVNGIPCIVLAHQSTVQLLCYIQPINPPETPRRKIGFIIDGESSEA